jgi:hypothetical protein
VSQLKVTLWNVGSSAHADCARLVSKPALQAQSATASLAAGLLLDAGQAAGAASPPAQ